MLVKVCGLNNRENIVSICKLNIDLIGFIFYKSSPRYFNAALNFDEARKISKNIKKVGVFVNEPVYSVLNEVAHYDLDFVQLHGNESVGYCKELIAYVKVIKVISVQNKESFSQLEKYNSVCDYFLFDTASTSYGGTGKIFDWGLLNDIKIDKPFFISGGISPENYHTLNKLLLNNFIGIDINSKFELMPGIKDLEKIFQLKQTIMKTDTIKTYSISKDGYYGEFGGAYIPELLYNNVFELQESYLNFINTPEFKAELDSLLQDYVGRPTPLYFAKNLSEKYNAKIYLKREDLNHTGSHKINNALGQALLAKKLNKHKIIAETGAGQHGVATATACALLGLECTVFMGEVDIERQAPNVARMKMLGAKIIPAGSGTKTLKDATNEAIRYWINNNDSYYMIGSVVGPHPYPDLVARFQSIISQEIKKQLLKQEGTENPNFILACIGGGSNAAGAFFNYIGNDNVKLIGIEAEGKGLQSNYTAATLKAGSVGIIHGSKTFLMQDNDGQINEPYSISAGLDYPGIGPLHAYLYDTQQANYLSVTDQEAINAAFELIKLEGIIPALESAHAFAALQKIKFKSSDVVVINLSGRGDKDLDTYLKYND